MKRDYLLILLTYSIKRIKMFKSLVTRRLLMFNMNVKYVRKVKDSVHVLDKKKLFNMKNMNNPKSAPEL